VTNITKCCLAFLLLPVAALADPALPRVRIETTAGEFVVELNAARAPLTVTNFLRYVRSGHYDGTVLHRVIAGFVVQGGGYDTQYRERPTLAPIPNESGNGLGNRRGTIAMARMEDPHSATAQFYINLADNVPLDPLPSRWGYAVFGQVIEGMEIVDAISQAPTGAAGPFPAESPLTPVVVRRMAVMEDAAPAVASPEPPAPAAQ
jgi:cyclophilin family peptidyl-prolyl cis-trans isomerase